MQITVEMEQIKVILDTDIGSDIDDAACLAYLLRQPRCELVGITTVSGEPEKRAMLADAICRVAKVTNIPIHSGLSGPFVGEQKQSKAQQAEVLPNWEHRKDFQKNTAIDYLRRTIRENPYEITLLAIGPLTNVAALFAVDPEIPRLLKSLVMMIGFFGYKKLNTVAEWNVYCDPVAAAMVFQTAEVESISIGLDVTTECIMSADECRQRFKGGPLDVVAEAAEIWFEKQSEVTFHDPLAATAIFVPELMKYTRGKVDVEINSPKLAGMTSFATSEDGGRHRVASKVNAEAFFQEYFGVLSS